MDGARVELASRGCRPRIMPLYEPPIWGEMRESNSRDWIHNPAPKPFGQSRHRNPANETWSWSSESNTRQRGTSSLHSHCARPAIFWSWRGDSNADHGLTRPELFPLSYTSTKTSSRQSGGGGENCTPDDLLCRQTPCCLGYTAAFASPLARGTSLGRARLQSCRVCRTNRASAPEVRWLTPSHPERTAGAKARPSCVP